MTDDLHALSHALALLECLLGPDERQPIHVSLPGKAWHRLHRLAMEKMTQESERSGHSGVVFTSAPPKSKDWSHGFWFHGCWVETPILAKPSPSELPVDETGPA